MNKLGIACTYSEDNCNKLEMNEEFAKNMYRPIPVLDEKVKDMFSGNIKKWKQIDLKEKLTSKPKELTVVNNYPVKGEAMGWPAYYKNPRLDPEKSGLGELAYMAHGRLQSSPLVKVRPEVKEKLDRCQKVLDSNPKTSHLQIVVVDGYRSLKVQKVLFETYRGWLKSQKPELNDEELDVEAQKMVSIPPKNKDVLETTSPPHTTGGSADLVLVDKRKIDIKIDDWVRYAMIDFGSDFDEMMHPEFGDSRSETRFFQNTGTRAEKNRNLLYNLMTEIGGFTNYHTEWWHFDFGNQFYAACKGDTESEYGFAGGIDCDNNIFESNCAEIFVLEKYRKKVGKITKSEEEDFGVNI